MFRAAAICVAILCLGSQSAATPTFNRDLSSAQNEDANPPQGRMIQSIIFAFKDQIKDIVEQIALQALEFMKTILYNIKVNLLKKLGTYTLSDLFHVIFDGVCDFVVESTPEVAFDPVKVPEGPKVYLDNDNDYAYALASLFRN